MINMRIFLTISFCYLCIPFSLNAQELTRQNIIDFAKQFVESQVSESSVGQTEVDIGKLDKRIKIKPCLSPLAAKMPDKHNGRSFNIEISCRDTAQWKMFIPTKVRTMIPVVVTNATVDKNTKLDRSNIIVVLKDRQRVHGEVLSEINQLIGTKAKRNLTLGAKVTKKNVCFVCKGDDVTIIAKSHDFMIKTAGVALRDGSLGDKVKVKNKHSNKTITAKVQSINKVVINL